MNSCAFSTALQVTECGVMPRPPMAVANARISRHLPTFSQTEMAMSKCTALSFTEVSSTRLWKTSMALFRSRCPSSPKSARKSSRR